MTNGVPEEQDILDAAIKALEEGCARSGIPHQLTQDCLDKATAHYKEILYKNADQTKEIVECFKADNSKWRAAMDVVRTTGESSVRNAPTESGTREVKGNHFTDAAKVEEDTAKANGSDWC